MRSLPLWLLDFPPSFSSLRAAARGILQGRDLPRKMNYESTIVNDADF
jgi:hypothetical protein